MKDYKLNSTLEDNSGRARLDTYWNAQGFTAFYKRFRKGIDLPKYIKDNPNSVAQIQERFKLRGIQFGNWVTTEDRFNYIAALYICFYDLNKVLKFKNNNLGLDESLGLAFGARGKSRALAHYEPGTNIINITRYSGDTSYSKMSRFLYTGGVGAVAHEYAHFLDFYFGGHYETHSSIYSLTNGSSTSRDRIVYPATSKMRVLVEDILQQAYWKSPNVSSNYYKRIRSKSERSYFVERTEIFARLFEQYIGYKLDKMGVHNNFLNNQKYNQNFYLNQKELKQMAPLFDKLIAVMRTYF